MGSGAYDMPVAAASAGLFRALDANLTTGRLFDHGHDQRADPVVVLGRYAAERLGVTTVDAQPSVFIGDRSFTVLGIVDRVTNRAEILDSVTMPVGTARAIYGLASPDVVEIRTRVGAPRQVGKQAPIALSPMDPELLQATVPAPPSRTRQQVTTDVNLLFLALGGVALLVGGLGIANVTLLSVLERVPEIGLRRAVGAGRGHFASQFVVESVVVGFLGGLIGATAGILTTVGCPRHGTGHPSLTPVSLSTRRSSGRRSDWWLEPIQHGVRPGSNRSPHCVPADTTRRIRHSGIDCLRRCTRHYHGVTITFGKATMSRKAEQYGGGVGDRGLGMELRYFREKAGLTLETVGARLGWSANTMSRLERGLRPDTTTDEVSAVLAIVGVTGKDRDRVMRMARRRVEQGWWEGKDAKLSDQVRTYRTFEQRATRIVNVEHSLIPGLLQTPEYMHALLLGLGEDKSDIPGRIARRLNRQELLDRRWDHTPEAVFVVCEHALRLPVGGAGLMARQVRHVAEQAEKSHVSVRIVPETVVVHPALRGSFVVLEFADESPVVAIEARMSGLFPDTPAEIEAYRLDAERLMDLALSKHESRDLLLAIAEDLERAR